MSTALAIAGVTAVLRDLLNDGLINHNISGLLGSSVTVSVQAPDRVVTGSTPEASQLNLFMYMVTPNLGWRNEGLPGRDGSGRTRLLIDLGWPGTLAQLTASLKHKGLGLSDLTQGLATHYHPDHAGLAEELKRSGMQLWCAPTKKCWPATPPAKIW